MPAPPHARWHRRRVRAGTIAIAIAVATMTSRGLRLYTAVVAMVCGLAIALGIQSYQAAAASDHWRAAWRAEARSWRSVAHRSIAANAASDRRYRALVGRYNHVVRATRRSQRQLLQALQVARSAPPPPVYTPGPVVYRSIPAPAPAPAVPASVPSPAPTTRTS